MWHPNIYEDGKVSIPVLRAPDEDLMSGESSGDRWEPEFGVLQILKSVIAMLNNPDTHLPVNADASA